jgi:hypothetical protein
MSRAAEAYVGSGGGHSMRTEVEAGKMRPLICGASEQRDPRAAALRKEDGDRTIGTL